MKPTPIMDPSQIIEFTTALAIVSGTVALLMGEDNMSESLTIREVCEEIGKSAFEPRPTAINMQKKAMSKYLTYCLKELNRS